MVRGYCINKILHNDEVEEIDRKALKVFLYTLVVLGVLAWTATVFCFSTVAVSSGIVETNEPAEITQTTESTEAVEAIVDYIEPVAAPIIPHLQPVSFKELGTTGGNGNKAEGMSGCGEKVATYYNVPLDKETQDQIFKLCRAYGIDEKIVLAMCWRESLFRADAVGDNGHSFGLMQIQKRYHGERMERLGVDNLLDPVQNVTVGIDFIAELFHKYGDIEKALVCYNCGEYGARQNFFNRGVYSSQYSRSVIGYANSLEVCEW
jgi:hypothetical protein